MRRSVLLLTLIALLVAAGGVAVSVGSSSSGDGSPEAARSSAGEDDGTIAEDAGPRERTRAAATPETGDDSEDADSAPTDDEEDLPTTVEGVVTRADTGEPVEGVTVHTWFGLRHHVTMMISEATSDAEGRWREEGWQRTAHVWAQGNGWVSKDLLDLSRVAWPGAVVRRLVPGTTERIDLVVEPAARVGGAVLDAGGRPAAGAWVRADFAEGDVEWRTQSAEADSEGRFLLTDLVPGVRYRITASAEGCAPAIADHVAAGSGETATIEIRLPPPRSIEVVVLDEATGAPIAEVVVAARPLDPAVWEGGPARTGSDGRARLTWLAPGEIDLFLTAPEHLPLRRPVRVSALDGIGDVAAQREVRLRRAASARITVLDDAGAPVEGCSVHVQRSEGGGDAGSERTDAAGVAQIPHLDESLRYDMEIGRWSERPEVVPRRIVGWAPRHEVVRVDRGLSIEGVVVDSAGTPLGGASVHVASADDEGIGTETADAAGRFRIPRLKPGTYLLTPNVPDNVGFTEIESHFQAEAGSRGVRLTCAPSSVVVLRCTNDASPEPWQRCVDLVDVESGESRSVETDDFDSNPPTRPWCAAGLVPGRRYRARFADSVRGIWAAADFVAGERAEVELAVRPGLPTSGRISWRPAGRDDRVSAGLGWLHGSAPIDAEGRFRFPGLAPGEWTFTARRVTEDGDVEVETVAEAGREDVVLSPR